MHKDDTLTQAKLQEVLHYDPDTGVFTWVRPKGYRMKAGDRAGWLDLPEGYRKIQIKEKAYKEHRLAFFYMTGKWPLHEVDHANGIRDDNRWANLRLAAKSENQQNRRLGSNSTTGEIGVSYHKASGKYIARIGINGKRLHLGAFSTVEEASEAYKQAKRKHHYFQPELNYV